MRALTNNTLVAISKHTNKVLKMATYMAQSEQSMLLDNIYMIDENTTQKDALELFQKDFDKTIDLIEKSHQLLSTVRGDHIIEQLDNNNKDIRNIFLDKYDEKTFSVQLPSVTLRLKYNLDRDDLRNQLANSVLGISYKDLKDFLKNCDKIYKFDEYTIETEEDAVEYLASIAYREKYDEIVNKIKEIAGEFSEYRNNLGLDNRNLIDNEITFTRSMIDSVTKSSTYITKKNVEQLASSHKKNMGFVQELFKFIKDNNYISSIELDPDTNLKSVLDILKKTEDLKLNIPEQFCLKCRKLGNYNANGLYLPKQHIAAVDITNPSALIHELTHTADISNPELYGHKLREELVNKVKKRIDTNDLEVKGRLHYFLNPDEVIARLGEISYILNKNNYSGNESMSDFISRVKIQEKEYNSEFLNIAKPIDEYLRKANIYFNFNTMNSSDLLEIRDYFKSYFGVNNDEIKPIYSKAIDYEKKITKKAKKRINEFKDSPFVKLDPTSVRKALDYNLEKGIIPFDDLFEAVAENIHMIARRKKGIGPDDFKNQILTTNIIYDWVANSGNKDIQVSLLKNMYHLGKTPSFWNNTPVGLSFTLAKTDEEIEKSKTFFNMFKNCHYLNTNGMGEFRRHHINGLFQIMGKLTFNDVYTRLDSNDLLTYGMLFSDTYRYLHNSIPGQSNRFETYIPQIISDLKRIGFDRVFDYAYNEMQSKNSQDFVFDKKHLEVMSETGYKQITYGKVINSNTMALSAHFLKYTLDHMVKIAYANTGVGIDPKEQLLNGDYSSFKPLLGINKVTEDNYRETRKAIMEQYLKDLQEKQAIELASKESINPNKPSVLDTIKKKIDEDEKLTAKIDEKIESKPIKVDSSSQIKLF